MNVNNNLEIETWLEIPKTLSENKFDIATHKL